MKNNVNIIIPSLGSSTWMGGFTYQTNLIESLKTREDISIYLAYDLSRSSSNEQKKSLVKKIIQRSKKNFQSIYNRIFSWWNNYDINLQNKLDKYETGRINILFTLNEAHLKAKKNILKLYWIPDFQHLHHSYLFSTEDLERRNHRFLEGCRDADIIMLSSRSAQDDLQKFAPQFASKSRISRFVSNVPSTIWSKNPATLIEKYSLPEKFFYLPNQFWKHKNHIIVFEALYLLKKQNIFPYLACSGNKQDYRDPEFYNTLLKQIDEWGLTEQIKFLGVIPHDDVLLLIRQAICLINPSLFEGWSTTVEECKSIGKEVILSEIEVHKEQAPAKVSYFNPQNPKQLAEILKTKWGDLNPGPDFILENQSKNDLNKRIKNYADSFIGIIFDYLENHRDKFTEF